MKNFNCEFFQLKKKSELESMVKLKKALQNCKTVNMPNYLCILEFHSNVQNMIEASQYRINTISPAHTEILKSS